MRQLTIASIASMLGRELSQSAQFQIGNTSGGQPGQTIQVNGITAICQQPIPPGQAIVVNDGQQWLAFAAITNSNNTTRIVQNRRKVNRPKKTEGYKIVVFYLTNDNSVFCREDANDPLLLVSQLPKRVQMGFSGSIGGDTVIPLGDEGIGGYDISDGFEINFTGQEFSIGNSLDDLREVVPPDRGQIFPEQLRYRRSTVDIFATSTSSQSTSITARLFGDAFFVARFNVSPPGSDNSGTRATAVFRYITGVNSGNLNYNQIRSTGSGSASWSIPSISNAYGFTARVLPGKTIFAVTDKIGFARFEAYRGRITTGTIDNFETYELPNVPTLDSDLFTENDGYSPTNKVPYSIINSFRFFNRYNADHSTTCFVDGINLFWFEGRDYMTSGSTVAIKIFDSAIHQNNSQAISQQIPGLPANTKAVLGVLACPV